MRSTSTAAPRPALPALLATLALASCGRTASGLPAPVTSERVPLAAPAPSPQLDAVPPASAAPSARAAPALGYPWLADLDAPRDGTLAQRFAPPAGFVRVELAPGTFGAWLRGLPLAPAGTPVRSYRGGVILPADDARLSAVVALDVGDADLQQCADSVLRLHAEWLFAQGRRDASYRAASGAAMPFARWARGERMVPDGNAFKWVPSRKADTTHASYRRWLDGVFAWANTGSLARDSDRVTLDDLRPGDFVVQPGAPGHAVLVLDMARGPGGRRAVLLGQGFMPAQSFHVLHATGGVPHAAAWFLIEPGAEALDTPFWSPFPWKALRRFPGT